MSSVFSCENCKQDYNEINKKPLSLPCGHVFCEECILTFSTHIDPEKIKEDSSFVCPIDSKVHQGNLKTIPICYQILINLPESAVNKNQLYCLRHPNRKIRYLCANHQTLPCSTCVVDHMGNGHELEQVEITIEKMNTEYKHLIEMCDSENTEAKDMKLKYEKIEKGTNEYFNHQYNKVELTFERLVHVLQEKRKKIIEVLNTSKLECRTHLKLEKEKLQRKCEKLESMKEEIINKLEEIVEKKRYEEFYVKKQVYLSEFKSISEIRCNLADIPFAYFSNSLKLEDFGCIKYYKSFKEIEQKYIEKKIQRKNQNFCKNELGHSNVKSLSKEKHLINVFQDNLLNNKNYSSSPQKHGNASKNILRVEKNNSSSSSNGNASKQFIEKNTYIFLNEFDNIKNEKDFSEFEKKISIKKEDFKKIAVEGGDSSKQSSKLYYNKKTSFPFSHREYPLPNSNSTNSTSNNPCIHHDKNVAINTQLKNENFFSNKMNRNHVILNTNINSTQSNTPIKPGSKFSNDKVFISPTNFQLSNNGSVKHNFNNNNYILNNFTTHTIASDKGDPTSTKNAMMNEKKERKLKNKEKEKEKVESNLNSINKILITQSENSMDKEPELSVFDKRSNSNKPNARADLVETKNGKKEIINRSSSNNKFNNLKKEEKKNSIPKNSKQKSKKNKQTSDSNNKSF